MFDICLLCLIVRLIVWPACDPLRAAGEFFAAQRGVGARVSVTRSFRDRAPAATNLCQRTHAVPT